MADTQIILGSSFFAAEAIPTWETMTHFSGEDGTMQVKQSTSFKVPVILVDSAGNYVTGQTFSSATVYLQKQGGSSAVKTLVSGDFTEVDATNFPGVYDLLLSTTDTNTIGDLKYSVVSGTSIRFYGLAEIVANIESDTFKILTGKWKIDTSTNKFIMYDSDNVTVLHQFNLKDSTGSPTSTSIFERDPI